MSDAHLNAAYPRSRSDTKEYSRFCSDVIILLEVKQQYKRVSQTQLNLIVGIPHCYMFDS